ncbi:hypothetical protein HRbin12_01805 [bacterium HR12]|nr:hypothetical protein HRbin12_01805 [bacterium HR12]
MVAAGPRLLGAEDRVVEAGTGDHAGEGGRLQERELARVLAPVGLRRRLHPVGAVAEVDRVQVPGEDLVLRELLLELDRQEHLAHLLPEGSGRHHVDLLTGLGIGLVGPGVDVLHQLLGDGGAALHGLPHHQVRPGGPQDPDRVEPGVLVEVLVLGGDHGLAEAPGHLLQRDDRPVHGRVQRGQQVPVPVVHVRGLQRRRRGRQLQARVQRVEDREHPEHADERNRDEGPPPAPEEAAHARAPPLPGGVLATSRGRPSRGVGRQDSSESIGASRRSRDPLRPGPRLSRPRGP